MRTNLRTSMGQALERLLLDEGGEIHSEGCQPPGSGISQVAGGSGKIADCRRTGLHSRAASWLTSLGFLICTWG